MIGVLKEKQPKIRLKMAVISFSTVQLVYFSAPLAIRFYGQMIQGR